MSIAEFVDGLIYPLRSPAALVVLLSFYLLGQLVGAAGLFGLWLAAVLVPALFRYLLLLAEARARDRDAAPPGIEFFSWVDNLWTLFPVVPLALFVWGVMLLSPHGAGWVIALSAVGASLFPAMMAVLVITHSPLQCLRPAAIAQLIRRVGPGYLYGPLLVVLSVLVPTLVGVTSLWLSSLIELYLLFAFYSVIGTMLRHGDLLDDVDITASDADVNEAELVRLNERRAGVLNHAYGFVSRGNSAGGLGHVSAWLDNDPQPAAARLWFFEQMLRWEDTDAALLFAQAWVGELLRSGRETQAVKIMLRARLVNERFRPRSGDLSLAIDAAEESGNTELAAALRRHT